MRFRRVPRIWFVRRCGASRPRGTPGEPRSCVSHDHSRTIQWHREELTNDTEDRKRHACDPDPDAGCALGRGFLRKGARAAKDRPQASHGAEAQGFSGLLAGLAQEDFVLIRDRARELRRIGEESLTKIAPNLPYVKYATEFVSIVDELDRRAKEEDLNGATVSYIGSRSIASNATSSRGTTGSWTSERTRNEKRS